ncbi:MAG TPA: type II toxin-antitoxin system VapC family toxin [Verrucomicrobiae bacterium]|nr:type II toxin-antitoxin system VapC family toxin [Verrucomicrobiae bacterium]
MKLLLDTHIWLWSVMEPKRLGPRTARELNLPENELWLSPVSTWEALLLARKGRITLQGDLDTWFSDATANTKETPLSHEIVIAAHRLQMHADPADRFLAATAQVLGLTLVTADEKLLGLGDIKSLANR